MNAVVAILCDEAGICIEVEAVRGSLWLEAGPLAIALVPRNSPRVGKAVVIC